MCVHMHLAGDVIDAHVTVYIHRTKVMLMSLCVATISVGEGHFHCEGLCQL